MIDIKGVYFSYDKKRDILKNINLSIKEGEITSILGPNGSGKTTLLKCINSILLPYKGEIYLDGNNVLKMRRDEIAKNIAYVPQEHKISFPYKVLDVIVLGRTPYIGLFSQPKKEDIKKCYEVLNFLNIEYLSEKVYTQISGGERKLCLIARALATDARVLLLDEPTANLDIKHETEVLNCIKKLTKEKKLTVIMTLHNVNLASLISDKIVLLKEGEIITCGEPKYVITEENIKNVYSCDDVLFLKDSGKIYIYPKVEERKGGVV